MTAITIEEGAQDPVVVTISEALAHHPEMLQLVGDDVVVGAGGPCHCLSLDASCACLSNKEEKREPLRAVVVVDAYSSGGMVARKAYNRGYAVVRVWSENTLTLTDHQRNPAPTLGMTFAATIQDRGDTDATLSQILDLGLDYVGILPGAESGVDLFDALSSRWGGHILSNGTALSAHRRDKYLMGEKVRQAGLRAVKQVTAGSAEEVESFVRDVYPHLTDDTPIKVILKPVRSSCSEDVVLAQSLEEALSAFRIIHNKSNQYGDINDTVLIQEYLQGTEYVVNCVSYKGEHKVVSLWQYDKRTANGRNFIYYGTNLFESADGVIEVKMGDYIRGVLDALGVVHGPSHAEVMWLHEENQPCLVEVGSRPHGGNGVHADLADLCMGYNQLDCMIDLIEDKQKFHALPPTPPRLKAHASVLMMVSYEEGTLVACPGVEKVKELASFQQVQLKVKPDHFISKTVDYLTTPGWVTLCHEDPEVVREDFHHIHQLLQDQQMFTIEASSCNN